MKGRTGILVLIVTLGLVASWMLGYREGQQTGAFRLLHEMGVSYDRDAKDDINRDKNQMDMDRDRFCNEIKRYKLSIAKDLNDNTQICGWPDIDTGPDNSDMDIDRKNDMDMDRDQVCNEIRRYKISMARDLDEHTQICGWSDMDGPETSN